MRRWLLFYPISVVLMLVYLTGVAGIVWWFRSRFGYFSMEDNVILEGFTFVFYGIAFGVALSHISDFWKTPLQGTYIMLLLLWLTALLREMGMQHWLTQTDTTAIKIRFFTNPNNPLSEKIVSGLLILAVSAVIIRLVYQYTMPIIRGFFKKDPLYWTICCFGGLGALSQFMDRFPSNYRKAVGETITEPWITWIHILEEGGESFLPLLFALAFVQYHVRQKQRDYS